MRFHSRSTALAAAAVTLLGLITTSTTAHSAPLACGTVNVALNRPATASSVENAGFPAGNAVDGNAGTRWSSQFSDPQWIQVDLGSSRPVCRVGLVWEAAYGRAYQLQVSDNASTWTTIFSTTTSTGGTQSLDVVGTGRYVRMLGSARATQWGYSLFELTVNVDDGGTGPGPVRPTDPLNPDLGPNTFVFSPSTPAGEIQNRANTIASQMRTNQFGTQRYAMLFKPGTYTANIDLRFYTHVAGLGLSPDDTNLNGHVRVEADWLQQGDNPNNLGNATQNFWRMAENMFVHLPGGQIERWAVSQAAPYRRMHLSGQVQLWNGGDGWSSGGLIADSRMDGVVVSGSQQQFLTRNSALNGGWNGSVWNMVFVGSTGTPAQNFPNPSHTVVDNTPKIREKPFLYVDGSGSYNVFVPAIRQNARGTSWGAGTPAGTSISLSQFFIVRPSDSAATINAALAAGRHLLFQPGIYHLNDTIRVTRADTVVLGLGLATLIPDTGLPAITVSDVDGVKLAGLLVDAGPVNSPVLVEMGPAGSTASHSANPSSLHDVFFRVGGAGAGRATVSLRINSNDVIGDHMWLWRGDHGAGVGWTVNTAANGLVVNGNNVLMYGLFVEHYQQFNVVWNGNGGRTYFFQNEMPYDPPNQAAWGSSGGGALGWASYKVANSVTSHEAWGVGSYCFFNVNPAVVASRAFEVPNTPNVRFHDLVSVSLGGVGTINRVINDTGGTANTATQVVYLVNYP
ncbi:discoidin domain-containing protein [Actinophytocola sp.]|uniref:discoidin domain-containing protein n=1 Tax=Actinophytocola sp. TaxID=1872138 RepID=UPI002D81063C|nr:discoidin domain-containing protein [Actinophytocola sp.]HET9138186.1 discoidin domain-containing protein [Actinophytocola sp.]